MTQYQKYLKSWTSERGITSFLGSDKPAFQQDWKEEKKGLRFGEMQSMGGEDINRAGEPFKKPKPKAKVPINKPSAAESVFTNPDLLKKIGSFTKGRPKEEILADIWDVLHKYYVAYENLNFYDWIGPNNENGRFGKSKKGRNLSKTYMEEIRKWTDILDNLVEKGVIEQYEEMSGEDYSTVDDPVKPKVLPTKEDILKRTNKWGDELDKLIKKL